MAKILYFTAGPVPTGPEAAAIAKLQTLAGKPYELGVRNNAQGATFPPNLEPCDYVAGTVPSAYSAKTVINPDAPPRPDNLPVTQAVVTNAQKITGVTGSGTVANIAVNPTTKVVTVTLSAS